MRLSGLVTAAMVLAAVTLLAQHSSGGGSISAGGFSGAGFSGGTSMISTSHGSSGSSGSHSSSGPSAAGSASSPASSGPSSSAKASAKGNASSTAARPKPSAAAKSDTRNPVSEPVSGAKKKGFFSFLRRSKPAPSTTQAWAPMRGFCWKGRDCSPCQSKAWNGLGCGLPFQYAQYQPYWQGIDCRALANELAFMRARMQVQVEPGDRLRYQMLLRQYEECLRHSRFAAIDPYAFFWDVDANLFSRP